MAELLTSALHVTTGDTYTFQVVLEAATIGTKTWRAQLRALAGAVVAASFTITSAAGSGAEAGNVVLTLTLPAATTTGMSGRYRWDLEQTEAAVVTTIVAGVLVVDAGITA